jgi:hypothetical protein
VQHRGKADVGVDGLNSAHKQHTARLNCGFVRLASPLRTRTLPPPSLIRAACSTVGVSCNNAG